MARTETLSVRVARMERLHADLAEKVNTLAEKTNILTDAQIRDREEARERERRLDERIAKLVSAIGELTRRNGR